MSPSNEELRPALKPPQFRLSTLLWTMAGVCIFLSVAAWLSPLGIGAAILFLLCVAAHVAGAKLGTKLRENGGPTIRKPNRLAPSPRQAPPTHLSRKTPPGLWIVVFTIVGSVAASLLGGTALSWMYWDRLDLIVAMFGYLFTGVIGAVAAFAGSSFLFTLLSANWEATQETTP